MRYELQVAHDSDSDIQPQIGSLKSSMVAEVRGVDTDRVVVTLTVDADMAAYEALLESDPMVYAYAEVKDVSKQPETIGRRKKMKTLKNVIEEIGGASELQGTTELAAECLAESAELVGSRDGYDIYALECGDYFLSHTDASTHLVTADDLADLSTEEARVVGAVVNLTGDDLDVIFDNGGGITVQARGFVHHYSNAQQAAEDVKGILAADYDPAGWEGDEPQFYEGESPDLEIERNGGYQWRTRQDMIDAIAETGPIDPYATHMGAAEIDFMVALTGREIEK